MCAWRAVRPRTGLGQKRRHTDGLALIRGQSEAIRSEATTRGRGLCAAATRCCLSVRLALPPGAALAEARADRRPAGRQLPFASRVARCLHMSTPPAQQQPGCIIRRVGALRTSGRTDVSATAVAVFLPTIEPKRDLDLTMQ